MYKKSSVFNLNKQHIDTNNNKLQLRACLKIEIENKKRTDRLEETIKFQ